MLSLAEQGLKERQNVLDVSHLYAHLLSARCLELERFIACALEVFTEKHVDDAGSIYTIMLDY